jgi:hypothetical protein
MFLEGLANKQKKSYNNSPTSWSFCFMNNDKSKVNMWYILTLFGQIGFIIAIPVAVLAYFGHRIDDRWHTSPLFILVGMGLALTISSIAIYTMIKKIEDK